MGEKSMIQLRRQWNCISCRGEWDVILDDKKVATIGPGKEQSLSILPGSHTVCLQSPSGRRSEDFSVDLSEDAGITLECGIQLQYVATLLAYGIGCLALGFAAGIGVALYSRGFIPVAGAICVWVACFLALAIGIAWMMSFIRNSQIVYYLRTAGS